MAVEPISDASGAWPAPELTSQMTFADWGSYGLRQYSGWVREEFLSDLIGRQGSRVYREMSDNNPTIGAILFAIHQAVRKIEWRIEAASDSPEAEKEVEFVQSLMDDMSHTWEDFVAEAVTMFVYGYSVHEIVYKRRNGLRPQSRPGPKPQNNPASSKFDDGRIGWRRLPIRGQDTIIKWFFNSNGQITGLTQQPWVGQLIDIPMEKLLLFRPTAHKNNPEGRSILRNSYRPYFFVKRLEEQEAIMIERLNGLPVIYVPSELVSAASAMNGSQPANPEAFQAYQQYKNIARNLRIDEQMGVVMPSDTYIDPTTGKPSNVRMYELQLLTPGSGSGGSGRRGINSNEVIQRYKLDMMMTILADFIQMGHEVRGTNNLASTKVDMFYGAIQGWTKGIASVLTRHGLRRIWDMNRLDYDLMPEIEPDLSTRVDLDGMGTFVANMAAAGMPLFPDDKLQTFLRDTAGLPEDTADTAVSQIEAQAALKPDTKDAASVKKYIARLVMEKIAQEKGLRP